MSLSPRSNVVDCDYLLERANAEIEAADRCSDACAEGTHRRLASLYLDRVFGEGREGSHPRPTLREKRRILASPLRLLKPVEDQDLAPAFDAMLRSLDSLSSPRPPVGAGSRSNGGTALTV